ncbi:hypothetical protein WJX74_001822 [Apatococcus lobatus]|uniref:DUF1736 domain-containing protein n=1 Tax=Apatococcus lobatus TaxID=904363 RepID=A0AAW1Q525_9CHLO
MARLAVPIAAVAAFVYLNTLPAKFAFDDNFAVLSNGDILHPGQPLWKLFVHDFWGQDIRSAGSHKSYRPVAIICMRWQRQIGDLMQPSKRLLGRPQSPDPMVFHACNLLLHALMTLMVYRLTEDLASMRKGLWQSPNWSTSPQRQPAEALSYEDWLCSSTDTEAAISALLFAVHPVHTEAVAGVVGQAELLSALLSGCAFLLYCRAVYTTQAVSIRMDNALAPGLAGKLPGNKQNAGQMRHWLLLVASMALIWASALTKEIGITAVVLMAATDLLLVTPLPPSTTCAEILSSTPQGTKKGPDVRQAASHVQLKHNHSLQSPVERGSSGQSSPTPSQGMAGALIAMAGGLRLLRLCILAVVVGMYVGLRTFLAGDHLVRIYRKVENPIPFIGPLPRVLTTGFLHAHYATMLLLPTRLSADWSFACVPPLEHLIDPRNLATVFLYAALVWAMAHPTFEILHSVHGATKTAFRQQRLQRAVSASRMGSQGMQERSQGIDEGSQGSKEGCHGKGAANLHGRWRLTVIAGLILAPFLPASNVLFYVGTFVAERLLYVPSVGVCMLAAHVITSAGHLASSPPGESRSGLQQWTMRKRVALGFVAILVLGWSCQTFLRNWDWVDEETLFRAANKVCPDSAKVQLNLGILERRHLNWRAALKNFRRAQVIEPGYCDPTYWIGLTLINEGRNTQTGIEKLEEAVGCHWTVGPAMQALSQVYQPTPGGTPGRPPGDTRINPEVLQRWARVLLRPGVDRVGLACDLLEQAAYTKALAGSNVKPLNTGTMSACTLRFQNTSMAASSQNVEELFRIQRCVRARASLMEEIKEHGTKSDGAKIAIAAYLQQAADCRHAADDASTTSSTGVKDEQSPFGGAMRSSPAHMLLIHHVQKADAEDAWLQREWGEVLALEDRLPEAARHFQAAGMLLAQQISSLAQGQPIKLSASHHALPHGAPAQHLQAHVEACQAAFSRLVRVAEVTGEQEMYCQSQKMLCDSYQLAASVLTGQAASLAHTEAQQCYHAVQRLAMCQ